MVCVSTDTTTDRTTTKSTRPMLGVPYIQGLSEQLSQTYQSHGVYMFHKPIHPKDKTPKEKLCGTIYHITCDEDTHHTYIGETKRPLSVRFKEQCKLDKPTGIGDHCNATGHSVSMDSMKVLGRYQDWMKRKVKVAIHIEQRAPSMNRDLATICHPSMVRSLRDHHHLSRITHPEHCVINIC